MDRPQSYLKPQRMSLLFAINLLFFLSPGGLVQLFQHHLEIWDSWLGRPVDLSSAGMAKNRKRAIILLIIVWLVLNVIIYLLTRQSPAASR